MPPFYFLIYDKDKEDGRRGRRIEEKILLDWYLRLKFFFFLREIISLHCILFASFLFCLDIYFLFTRLHGDEDGARSDQA